MIEVGHAARARIERQTPPIVIIRIVLDVGDSVGSDPLDNFIGNGSLARAGAAGDSDGNRLSAHAKRLCLTLNYGNSPLNHLGSSGDSGKSDAAFADVPSWDQKISATHAVQCSRQRQSASKDLSAPVQVGRATICHNAMTPNSKPATSTLARERRSVIK